MITGKHVEYKGQRVILFNFAGRLWYVPEDFHGNTLWFPSKACLRIIQGSSFDDQGRLLPVETRAPTTLEYAGISWGLIKATLTHRYHGDDAVAAPEVTSPPS